MKRLISHFSPHIKNRRLMLSVAVSIAILLGSFVVNFYAGLYANERASNAVTDLILSNIPVFNVDLIFVYGPFLMWFYVAILCLMKPNRIPFILKSIALFVVIRSLFIILTHIGPFPDNSMIDSTSEVIQRFTFGGDLFFSAHTGLPFLMALIFWNEPRRRHIFIILSIFFGAVVLMGHLHYSIDVLAAFFITYSIFHIARELFPKDLATYSGELPS